MSQNSREQLSVERLYQVLHIVATHEAVTPDLICHYLNEIAPKIYSEFNEEYGKFSWFDVTDILHELLNLGMIGAGTTINGIAQDAILSPELSGKELKEGIRWRKEWRDNYRKMEEKIRKLEGIIWQIRRLVKEEKEEPTNVL